MVYQKTKEVIALRKGCHDFENEQGEGCKSTWEELEEGKGRDNVIIIYITTYLKCYFFKDVESSQTKTSEFVAFGGSHV